MECSPLLLNDRSCALEGCRELVDHADLASGVGARTAGGSRYITYIMIVKCKLYAIGRILKI
jgi:hypothetical protein